MTRYSDITLRNGTTSLNGACLSIGNGSTVLATNLTLSNCNASGNGGAIAVGTTATFTIDHSSIDHSTADLGGGMYCDSQSVRARCIPRRSRTSSATDSGGGIFTATTPT